MIKIGSTKMQKASKASIIIFGLIFVIVGLLATFLMLYTSVIPEDYVITEGYISNISSYYSGGETHYTVFGSIWVNDALYESQLNVYMTGMNVGDIIKIAYDPSDPNIMMYAEEDFMFFNFFPLIFSIIGIIMMVTSLKSMKKSSQYIEDFKNNDVYNQPNNSYSSYDEDEEYFFTYSGKANQGHTLFDKEKREVFVATLTKFHLLKPYEFEFNNKLEYRTDKHLIGHTISSGYGSSSIHVTTNSYFTFDGVNIWDYLEARNVEIRLEDLTKYGIYRCNEEIAKVEMTSYNYLNKEKKGLNIPTNGCYKVICDEDDIEIVFICLLALTRCYH